jgi:hypothetical protein
MCRRVICMAFPQVATAAIGRAGKSLRQQRQRRSEKLRGLAAACNGSARAKPGSTALRGSSSFAAAHRRLAELVALTQDGAAGVMELGSAFGARPQEAGKALDERLANGPADVITGNTHQEGAGRGGNRDTVLAREPVRNGVTLQSSVRSPHASDRTQMVRTGG